MYSTNLLGKRNRVVKREIWRSTGLGVLCAGKGVGIVQELHPHNQLIHNRSKSPCHGVKVPFEKLPKRHKMLDRKSRQIPANQAINRRLTLQMFTCAEISPFRYKKTFQGELESGNHKLEVQRNRRSSSPHNTVNFCASGMRDNVSRKEKGESETERKESADEKRAFSYGRTCSVLHTPKVKTGRERYMGALAALCPALALPLLGPFSVYMITRRLHSLAQTAHCTGLFASSA